MAAAAAATPPSASRLMELPDELRQKVGQEFLSLPDRAKLLQVSRQSRDEQQPGIRRIREGAGRFFESLCFWPQCSQRLKSRFYALADTKRLSRIELPNRIMNMSYREAAQLTTPGKVATFDGKHGKGFAFHVEQPIGSERKQIIFLTQDLNADREICFSILSDSNIRAQSRRFGFQTPGPDHWLERSVDSVVQFAARVVRRYTTGQPQNALKSPFETEFYEQLLHGEHPQYRLL